jgi:hypothetical protein
MTTKIIIPCHIGGKIVNTDFFVGSPYQTETKIENPIRYQAEWLEDKKGCTIPGEIQEVLTALCVHSIKTGKPIEELVDLTFNKRENAQGKQISQQQTSISPTAINSPAPKQTEKGQSR